MFDSSIKHGVEINREKILEQAWTSELFLKEIIKNLKKFSKK